MTRRRDKERKHAVWLPFPHVTTLIQQHSFLIWTAKREDLNCLLGRSSFHCQMPVCFASPLQQPTSITSPVKTEVVLHLLMCLLGNRVLSNNISTNAFKRLFLIGLVQQQSDTAWLIDKSHSVHYQNVTCSKECRLVL